MNSDGCTPAVTLLEGLLVCLRLPSVGQEAVARVEEGQGSEEPFTCPGGVVLIFKHHLCNV